IGNAHSGYYETLLNGGIIGLVLMVLLSLKIIKDLVQGYITQKSGELSAALIAIILLQLIVNAVGYIILNHNSADMVIYTVVSFMASFMLLQSKLSNTKF
ncbi:MAG: O-antigen ligase family protein, partial [Paraglaciecola sp.]|nr:O-antigen ligase family protein [Paraglaciecola sp.]